MKIWQKLKKKRENTSFKGGDIPEHMYVNIFRKGSVGLFQEHLASISEAQI